MGGDGNRKVLVIGLDGMPWSVLDRLIERGVTPVLGRLKSEGAHGILKSTIPPVTGPAWVGFATGMGPGDVGIFDFVKSPDGIELTPITTKDIKYPTFYEILDSEKRRSVIVNLPVSYPQKKIDGIIVTSLMTQDMDRIMYPKAKMEEYKDLLDKYSIEAPVVKGWDTDSTLGYLEKINEIETGRYRLARELMMKEPWDLFFLLFSVTDWMFHRGVGHILAEEGHSPEIGKGMEGVMAGIDEHVGELMELAGEGATTFVISDHGHTTIRWRFHVNRWLMDLGLLRTKLREKGGISGSAIVKEIRRGPATKGGMTSKTLARVVTKLGQNPVMSSVMERVKRIARDRFGIEITTGGELIVDKKASTAFIHTPESLGIFFNPGFEERSSKVERKKIVDELIRDLKGLVDGDGEPLLEGVWLREELYEGEGVDKAPRIMFLPKPGVACHFAIGPGAIERETRLTGWHTIDGIFIARGPNIRPGAVKGASIIDMAPTILAVFGYALQGMKGKALDIFKMGPETKPLKRKTEEMRVKEKISKLKGMGKL